MSTAQQRLAALSSSAFSQSLATSGPNKAQHFQSNAQTGQMLSNGGQLFQSTQLPEQLKTNMNMNLPFIPDYGQWMGPAMNGLSAFGQPWAATFLPAPAPLDALTLQQADADFLAAMLAQNNNLDLSSLGLVPSWQAQLGGTGLETTLVNDSPFVDALGAWQQALAPAPFTNGVDTLDFTGLIPQAAFGFQALSGTPVSEHTAGAGSMDLTPSYFDLLSNSVGGVGALPGKITASPAMSGVSVDTYGGSPIAGKSPTSQGSNTAAALPPSMFWDGPVAKPSATTSPANRKRKSIDQGSTHTVVASVGGSNHGSSDLSDDDGADADAAAIVSSNTASGATAINFPKVAFLSLGASSGGAAAPAGLGSPSLASSTTVSPKPAPAQPSTSSSSPKRRKLSNPKKPAASESFPTPALTPGTAHAPTPTISPAILPSTISLTTPMPQTATPAPESNGLYALQIPGSDQPIYLTLEDITVLANAQTQAPVVPSLSVPVGNPYSELGFSTPVAPVNGAEDTVAEKMRRLNVREVALMRAQAIRSAVNGHR